MEVQSVSKKCFETYPCQHDVVYVDNAGVTHQRRFNGTEILKLIREGQWKPQSAHEAKHFERYEKDLSP